ncbi:MAG: hypothetical protein HOW73_46325 [Polyangiaceae bacterium]|nr:hypothetical protein [Polyangiaceae bacterium]
MDLHANVRAWEREEDGSYKSELEGYSLHVVWRPEKPGERRGFIWKVAGPDGVVAEAHGVEEEIELAMARAENVARRAHGGLILSE